MTKLASRQPPDCQTASRQPPAPATSRWPAVRQPGGLAVRRSGRRSWPDRPLARLEWLAGQPWAGKSAWPAGVAGRQVRLSWASPVVQHGWLGKPRASRAGPPAEPGAVAEPDPVGGRARTGQSSRGPGGRQTRSRASQTSRVGPDLRADEAEPAGRSDPPAPHADWTCKSGRTGEPGKAGQVGWAGSPPRARTGQAGRARQARLAGRAAGQACRADVPGWRTGHARVACRLDEGGRHCEVGRGSPGVPPSGPVRTGLAKDQNGAACRSACRGAACPALLAASAGLAGCQSIACGRRTVLSPNVGSAEGVNSAGRCGRERLPELLRTLHYWVVLPIGELALHGVRAMP